MTSPHDPPSTPTLPDPLALFDAALTALNAEDWRAAAELCDTVSLRAFRRQLLEQFASDKPRRELTVEDFLLHSPGKPRQVAEYELAQHRRRADPRRRLHEELPGVASVDDLRQLDPVEVFARWLDGRSIRRQVARLVADARIPQPVDDAAQRPHQQAYIPLGVVRDGARLAHVIYRHHFSLAESPERASWLAKRPPDEQELARDMWGHRHPSVITCRRQSDDTWRFIADHSFFNVGSIHVREVLPRADAKNPKKDAV